MNTQSIESNLLSNPVIADHPRLLEMITAYIYEFEAGYDPGEELLQEIAGTLAELSVDDPAISAAIEELTTLVSGDTCPREFDSTYFGSQSRDTFLGALGDTLIEGNGGGDTLLGDIQTAYDGFVGGNDLIDGGAGRSFIVGDASDVSLSTGTVYGGDDCISGNGLLVGDFSVLSSNNIGGVVWSGDDVITSISVTSSGSQVFGDAAFLIGFYGTLNCGNDTIFGDENQNVSGIVYGDVGYLDSSDCEINCGNDVIHIGAGVRLVFGDADFFGFSGSINTGADVFVFKPDSSLTTIEDFESGKDKIDLSAYGIQRFNQLQIEDLGVGAVVIDLDGSAQDIDEIYVVGNVTSEDFIFA